MLQLAPFQVGINSLQASSESPPSGDKPSTAAVPFLSSIPKFAI